MKKIKLVIVSLLCLMALPSWAEELPAYPCQIRLMKTTCWKDVQVTVVATDVETHKKIGNPIVLGKDSTEITETFPCKPSQTMTFSATISPPVWEDVDTVYPSVSFWDSPSRLPKNADKWIVSLCFPDSFSSVPLPMTTSETCACHFDELANSRKSVSEALGKPRTR